MIVKEAREFNINNYVSITHGYELMTSKRSFQIFKFQVLKEQLYPLYRMPHLLKRRQISMPSAKYGLQEDHSERNFFSDQDSIFKWMYTAYVSVTSTELYYISGDRALD